MSSTDVIVSGVERKDFNDPKVQVQQKAYADQERMIYRFPADR